MDFIVLLFRADRLLARILAGQADAGAADELAAVLAALGRVAAAKEFDP